MVDSEFRAPKVVRDDGSVPFAAPVAGADPVDDAHLATKGYVDGVGGSGVGDGDKGDIVVSGSGSVWTLDSTVATAAGRALIDDADAAAQRATLGLGSAAQSSTSDFEATGAVATHAALNTGVHGLGGLSDTIVFTDGGGNEHSVVIVRGLIQSWTISA